MIMYDNLIEKHRLYKLKRNSMILPNLSLYSVHLIFKDKLELCSSLRMALSIAKRKNENIYS